MHILILCRCFQQLLPQLQVGVLTTDPKFDEGRVRVAAFDDRFSPLGWRRVGLGAIRMLHWIRHLYKCIYIYIYIYKSDCKWCLRAGSNPADNEHLHLKQLKDASCWLAVIINYLCLHLTVLWTFPYRLRGEVTAKTLAFRVSLDTWYGIVDKKIADFVFKFYYFNYTIL